MRRLPAAVIVFSLLMIPVVALAATGYSNLFSIDLAGVLVDAGEDEIIEHGQTVFVDASVGGGTPPLTFSWSLTGRPSGSAAVIADPSAQATSFDADVPGTYYVRLDAQDSLGATATDTKWVRAVDCGAGTLTVYPKTGEALLNESLVLTAQGGVPPYTWSFAANATGASLVPGGIDDRQAVYMAPAPGTDTVLVQDSVCGSGQATIIAGGDERPRVYGIQVPPYVTDGTVTVRASFDRAVAEARLFITEEGGVPGPASVPLPMTTMGSSASIDLSVSGHLAVGKNRLWVEGSSVDNPPDWGPASTRLVTRAPELPLLVLLHGWNSSQGGPHPETWELFTRPAYLPQMFADMGWNDRTLVHYNLDSWADPFENADRIADFLRSIPFVQQVGEVVLVGYSYGGIMIRAFLRAHLEELEADGIRISHVVTIATPHDGATSDFVAKIWPNEQDHAFHYLTRGEMERWAERGDRPGVFSVQFHEIGAVWENCVTAQNVGLTCYVEGNDDVVSLDSATGYTGGDNWRGIQFQTTYPLHRGGLVAKALGKTLHTRILSEDEIPVASLFWEETLRPVLEEVYLGEAAVERRTEPRTALPAGESTRVITTRNVTVGGTAESVTFPVGPSRLLEVEVRAKDTIPRTWLEDPSGQALDPWSEGVEYSGGCDGDDASVWWQTAAETAGEWTVSLQPAVDGRPYEAIVQVLTRAGVELSASASHRHVLLGEELVLRAAIEERGVPVVGASAAAVITDADGDEWTLTLHDDGLHGDGGTGDGVYGGFWTAAGAEGSVRAEILATGVDSGSNPFSRETVLLISQSLGGGAVAVSGYETAEDADGDGLVDRISVPVSASVPGAGHHTVRASLRGDNSRIAAQDVVSFATDSAQSVPVELVFEGRAIHRSEVPGPYVVDDVELVAEDAGGLLLARGDDSPLTGAYGSWLDFESPMRAELAILAPRGDVVTGGEVTVRWEAADGDGNDLVDFYWDTDESGFDGSPIPEGQDMREDAAGDFTWNVDALPEGTYFIYAVASSGEVSRATYGGSVTRIVDVDDDAMPDSWESANGTTVGVDDAADDPDDDGLSSITEYVAGTLPTVADSDLGGEDDGSEIANQRDPNDGSDDLVGVVDIAAATPARGHVEGGDAVVLIGVGFEPATTVMFGATPAPEVHYVSPSRVVALSPPGTYGTVSISATTSGLGTGTLDDAFEYALPSQVGLLFADGFESGGTSAWDASVP